MSTVLLYYKYVSLPHPAELVAQQKELCQRLGIKGRIRVADEGINGTVSGTPSAVAEYQRVTALYPGLENMEWKVSEGPENAFPRLSVLHREEIVTLGLKKQARDVCVDNKADYIEPSELKQLYESGQEFYIVDARNEYESQVGKFKNAITPSIRYFRQFPDAMQQYETLKDKTVVTYCTGGIRCEKASAFLKEQGFKNVRQLHGGVHRYAEETGGQYFEGELYVFDQRVLMPVNEVDPCVISHCHHCGTAVARFVDCCNDLCGTQFICCEKCEKEHQQACSSACAQSPKRRKVVTEGASC